MALLVAALVGYYVLLALQQLVVGIAGLPACFRFDRYLLPSWLRSDR